MLLFGGLAKRTYRGGQIAGSSSALVLAQPGVELCAGETLVGCSLPPAERLTWITRDPLAAGVTLSQMDLGGAQPLLRCPPKPTHRLRPILVCSVTTGPEHAQEILGAVQALFG